MRSSAIVWGPTDSNCNHKIYNFTLDIHVMMGRVRACAECCGEVTCESKRVKPEGVKGVYFISCKHCGNYLQATHVRD